MYYNIDTEKSRNTLGTKIRKIRNDLGLKQSEVVEKLCSMGCDIKPNAYGAWEKGVSAPSAYQLFALCIALNVKNPMETFAGINDEVPLNDEGKKKVREYVRDLVDTGRYTPEKERIYVPVRKYYIKPAAGHGDYLNDSDYEMTEIPEDEYVDGTDYVLEISGNSMEPVYQPGQTVCVKKTEQLRSGDIGIFMHNGDSLIKKFDIKYNDNGSIKSITLISFNPDYPPRHINKGDEFAILGKVLS